MCATGLALGTMLLGGCAAPGDTGTTYPEAAALARTCQSLLERRTGEPAPPIDPAFFQAAMNDPRLTGRATAEVLIRVCDGIGRRSGAAAAS